MKILITKTGYVVTDEVSTAKTFDETDFDSREKCRIAAISYADTQEKKKNSPVDVLFRKTL